MGDEQARVLARSGNLAVTHLNGRSFPGVHLQGDTFAELQRQLAHAIDVLRSNRDDADGWSDLEDVGQDLADALRFYEAALEADGIQRPYFRKAAD